MKRKRNHSDDEYSSEDDENSEQEHHSNDDKNSNDDDDYQDYNEYKDKLFGQTDEIHSSLYDLLDEIDEEDDGIDDDENYKPSELTRRLDNLLESIASGVNSMRYSCPKDRSDLLRIIIKESTDPFSIYIMDDGIQRKTSRKKNESFVDYAKRCTTKYDAKIVDFLTKCNNRFKLFALYYGTIIFNYKEFNDDEEDYFGDEEREIPRVIDVYHSVSGKKVCNELLVEKKGDFFNEISLLMNDNANDTAIGLIIVPRHANLMGLVI